MSNGRLPVVAAVARLVFPPGCLALLMAVFGEWVRRLQLVSASRPSRKDFVNRLATLSDGDRPAGSIVDRQIGVDAETVIDGGDDVSGRDGAVLDEGGLGVGGAAHAAA